MIHKPLMGCPSSPCELMIYLSLLCSPGSSHTVSVLLLKGIPATGYLHSLSFLLRKLSLRCISISIPIPISSIPICMCVGNVCLHVFVHVYMYTFMYIYTYVHIYSYVYTCNYTLCISRHLAVPPLQLYTQISLSLWGLSDHSSPNYKSNHSILPSLPSPFFWPITCIIISHTMFFIYFAIIWLPPWNGSSVEVGVFVCAFGCWVLSTSNSTWCIVGTWVCWWSN